MTKCNYKFGLYGQDESPKKFTLSEVEGLPNSKVLSPQRSFGNNDIIQENRKNLEERNY